MMAPTMYRIIGFLVIALWICAVLMPAAEVTQFRELFNFTSEELLSPDGKQGGPGWLLLELGWLGPLEFTIAWYANIPLVLCVIQMAMGRSPGRRTSLIGLAVALMVFLPFRQTNFPEDRGYYLAWEGGPAVWAWLAAFTLTTIATFMPTPTVGLRA